MPPKINNAALRKEIDNYPCDDYWEIFVLKHQNPFNILIHMLSAILFYGIPITALYTRNLWILCLMPFSSGIGVLGHTIFERTNVGFKDSVFSPQVVRCSTKMFYRVITGKYFEDIQKINTRFLNYLQK